MYNSKRANITCNMDLHSDINQPSSTVEHNSYNFRHELPFPTEIGRVWVDIIPLNINSHISHSYHYFNEETPPQLYSWTDIKAALDEPVLAIHSAQIGHATIKENCVDVSPPLGRGMSIIQHVDKFDFSPILDTSAPLEVVMLKISMSFLHRILGEDNTVSLLEAFDVKKCNSASSRVIPEHISAILYSINQCGEGFNDELKILHAEAKILEYLTQLVSHVNSPYVGKRSRKRNRLIHQLYDELLCIEGKIPPLDDIALRYGLSLRTLNDEFKECYGKPIWTFITEYRLDQAHKALKESDIAIKVLADKLGYSHVNHFSNAFKRNFGYSPGSLRSH